MHDLWPVQKFVDILGHPLTATHQAWLIELKGQRSAAESQAAVHISYPAGGSPIL